MTQAAFTLSDHASLRAPVSQRVFHPLKRRLVTASEVTALVPDSLLVTFIGEDLSDFVTLGFDDHVKLFFPLAGTHARAQTAEEFTEQHVIASRHFTPRRFDPVRREMQVQFYLHGEGPAASWARQAQPGDQLVVAGPKSSRVLLASFDWLLLFGDETALPAIERLLEECPPWQRVLVVLLTCETSQQISLQSAAELTTVRIGRTASDRPFSHVISELGLPVGKGLVWAAGEASDMDFMEHHFVAERRMPSEHVLTAAYWHRGEAAANARPRRRDGAVSTGLAMR